MQINALLKLEWEASPCGCELQRTGSFEDNFAPLLRAKVRDLPSELWFGGLVGIGPGRPTRPLEAWPDLFEEFADLPFKIAAYDAFARRHGTLTDHLVLPMVKWAALHASMRGVLCLPCTHPEWVDFFIPSNPLTYLRAIVHWAVEPSNIDIGPTPQFALIAKDLRAGIAFQTLHSLSLTQGGVRQCCNPTCGRYFEYGTGTDRRSTKRYCSEQCRGRDYYRRTKSKRK